jgi:hemerythrin superfamily protein
MSKPTELAGKLAGQMKGIAKRLEGYKGVFRRLAEEHTEVSVLLRRVRTTKVAEVRRELFPKIRREVLSHARAEEQEFYLPFERFNDTRMLVEQARTAHRRIEVLIDQLTVGDPAQPAWVETFDVLCQAIVDHVQEEEEDLFPRARQLIGDREMAAMEERYFTTKKDIMCWVG